MFSRFSLSFVVIFPKNSGKPEKRIFPFSVIYSTIYLVPMSFKSISNPLVEKGDSPIVVQEQVSNGGVSHARPINIVFSLFFE